MRDWRTTRVGRLMLLYRTRGVGVPVPLPDVQRAAGAQHGARHKELRAMGFQIDNFMKRGADGQTHSFYVMRFDPGVHRESSTAPVGAAQGVLLPMATLAPAVVEDCNRNEAALQRRRSQR